MKANVEKILSAAFYQKSENTLILHNVSRYGSSLTGLESAMDHRVFRFPPDGSA